LGEYETTGHLYLVLNELILSLQKTNQQNTLKKTHIIHCRRPW